MKTTVVLILLVVTCAAMPAATQEVFLRQHGFGTYEYSLDGISYHNIGTRNYGLALVLQSDSVASAQLERYHDTRAVGKSVARLGFVVAVVGSFVVLKKDDKYDRKNPDFTAPWAIGMAITFAGIITNTAADNYLKAAVLAYNSGSGAGGSSIGLYPDIKSRSSTELCLGIVYRF